MKRNKVDTKTENNDRIKDANKKLRSENRELKKELTLLKRDLKRLRKESLRHATSALDMKLTLEADLQYEFEDLQVDATELPESKKYLTCPHCSSNNVEEIPAGLFTIVSCSDCGKRRKMK